MDQKQLLKKLLMNAFLPKPHLDQNQNVLQELVDFYEIFEVRGSKHSPQVSKGSAGMFNLTSDIILLECYV